MAGFCDGILFYMIKGRTTRTMKTRRFRAYAEREDLQTIFKEFQGRLEAYYVPTYSDKGRISYHSIMEIENIGVNFHGSHIGNMQMLIFPKNTECIWRTYRCRRDDGQEITRYSAFDEANSAWICVDLNGIYQEKAIFPTEISTIHYDDGTAKMLYDELKKIVRKQAVKTVNGAFICRKVYEHREKYRFCTIDFKSPTEYDLKVE